MGKVMAPPYDVISAEMQERLYALHPHNVVRLILGKIFPDDTETNNRYTRAAADLRAWQEAGMLTRYPRPAIYIYSQEYAVDGERFHRAGFVARVKADPYGQGMVFPHERTLSGPKTDRLNLTRACRMNFSKIFGLYSDPSNTMDRMLEEGMKASKPAVDETVEGVRHRMWPVSDPGFISRVVAFMADKEVVIADGHHRYETAVNYRAERSAQEGGVPGDYDYCLMFLSNTHGQGFTVLPTHRYVLQTGLSADAVAAALAEDFQIKSMTVAQSGIADFMRDLKDAGKETVSFGMYSGGGAMRLLRLKKGAALPHPPGSEKIAALRGLDVTILQELILSKALHITREKVEAGGHIYYTVSAAEAMEKVDGGAAKMAFLMNPTGIGQVMEIARGGGVMPQKSTYFYPKLISGLVFNPL